MANGNSFINLDREVVAAGLTRLLNQGIGTPVSGVPSFNDTDMRKFLLAKNLGTPTTIPNQPLEDHVGSIAIDPSVQVKQDLSGILAIQERITEATVQKNQIAALNLENIKADPQVASAKEQLNQLTQDSMFIFTPGQAPIIENKIKEATAALLTAEEAARQRSAIETAAQVAEIDNEILRLQNQENSLKQIIAEEERTRPTFPASIQKAVVDAEGLTDLTEVQSTFDNYTADKKTLVKSFAALDPNKFFAWNESIVQDVDRDAYIAMVVSRLSIEDGRRFKEQIPQFDRQLDDAQVSATDALAGEQSRLAGTAGQGNLASFEAQRAWMDNHIAQTMNDNTGSAFDTFVKGSTAISVTREGFSSDQMWRTSQQLQGNIDPTKANMQAAIASALTNMQPMTPDVRNNLITEYMRNMQSRFNAPRNVFGMGINQVTIDTLADDIANRMVRVDAIKAREQFIEFQQEALSGAGQFASGRFGVERAGPIESFIGQQPDSRAAIAPTTITTSGQTAADVALAPITALQSEALRTGRVEGINAVRAAKIAADNPGLLEEEAAMLASSNITGISNFLNELNPQEVQVVTEQMRAMAGLSTDPAEKNMLELLLNKIEKFSTQSRQSKTQTDSQGNTITKTVQ